MDESEGVKLDGNAIDQVVGLAAAAGDIRYVRPTADAEPFVVLPQGHVVFPLSGYVPVTPDRKRARVGLDTEASFVEYVQDHATPSTRVFAAVNGAPYTFLAAIDYHPAGPEVEAASFVTHVASLTLVPSEEWAIWWSANREPMAQTAFAEFIEDNLLEIVSPDGATMLEVVKTLQGSTTARWKSAVRLETGDRHCEYEETTDARAGRSGGVDIPYEITLALPPFLGCTRRKIDAHFRPRVVDGKLTLSFQLVRPRQRAQFLHCGGRSIRTMLHVVVPAQPVGNRPMRVALPTPLLHAPRQANELVGYVGAGRRVHPRQKPRRAISCIVLDWSALAAAMETSSAACLARACRSASSATFFASAASLCSCVIWFATCLAISSCTFAAAWSIRGPVRAVGRRGTLG